MWERGRERRKERRRMGRRESEGEKGGVRERSRYRRLGRGWVIVRERVEGEREG